MDGAGPAFIHRKRWRKIDCSPHLSRLRLLDKCVAPTVSLCLKFLTGRVMFQVSCLKWTRWNVYHWIPWSSSSTNTPTCTLTSQYDETAKCAGNPISEHGELRLRLCHWLFFAVIECNNNSVFEMLRRTSGNELNSPWWCIVVWRTLDFGCM
jgi:hypothetical protein